MNSLMPGIERSILLLISILNSQDGRVLKASDGRSGLQNVVGSTPAAAQISSVKFFAIAPTVIPTSINCTFFIFLQ